MTAAELFARDFTNELVFTASRSSGAGGQNVNKVNTRMELRFNIAISEKLSVEEKALLLEKLAGRINSEQELMVVSQTERTQSGNKTKATERFFVLMAKALTLQIPRKATKPSKASKQKRLDLKKLISQKKQHRSVKDFE